MGITYDDSSINLLVGAARVRTRPASMLGSSGVDGARHGFTEIRGNSLDEATAGYGHKLEVHYYTDGSISVRDYGRGVPLGWNSKPNVKNWNWHTIYNELYGGAKYETNQEELGKVTDWSKFDPTKFMYLFSVGLNGLGAASTQYTSEFFDVRSYRGGVCKSRSFRRGFPLVNGEPVDMFSLTKEEIEAIPEEVSDTEELDGTFIHWKPDDTVFDNVDIGSDWLYSECEDMAGVSGIELHFIDDNIGKDITIPAGTLSAVLRSHAKGKLIPGSDGDAYIFEDGTLDHGVIKVEGKPFIWVCKADIVFSPTSGSVETACYHNSVKMKSGVQYNAVQDAIYLFLKDKVKVAGVKLEARDYDGILGVVVSSYSNYASIRNQTKDAVDDDFIYRIVHNLMLSKLNLEYGKGTDVITDLVNRVIAEAVNRKAAQDFIKTKQELKKIQRLKEPDKFVTCEAYEKRRYSEAELWITEGDSAKGGVKNARDRMFQAIYPIRGKGLNVCKVSLDKVLKNKEIRDIFALIGTGMDLNGKGDMKTFNIADLKFGKIIFATDADEDGYQIRVLLFLIFYRFAPELIRGGYVYVAETPRFQIRLVDGTCLYARNDTARDEILANHMGRVRKVSRFKGLGEVSAEVLRETTVHPEKRQLVQLTCDLESSTERDLIDALFGADKYKQRKGIISSILNCDISDMLGDNGLILESSDMDGDDSEEDDGTMDSSGVVSMG